VPDSVMFTEHECRLARLAIQNRYLTRNQIQACLARRREAGAATTLEDVFLEHHFLTPEEIDELSRLVSSEAEAESGITRLFARIARRRGLATEEQIEEALRFKRALAARKIRRPLGQILVEQGVLTLGQVAEILAEQERAREAAAQDCRRYKAFVPQEMVGRGPRGTVCRARHPEYGEVALKVIPWGSAPPGALERLRGLRDLELPYTARILEAGYTENGIYLASEFVLGIPLYDHVAGSVRLPVADATRLLRPVAQALQAAHARGLAHGGLSPQNVLVTERREPRITDFGLACNGGGPADDLRACRDLWRFMIAGEAGKGDVPPLNFDSATTLLGELERWPAEPHP